MNLNAKHAAAIAVLVLFGKGVTLAHCATEPKEQRQGITGSQMREVAVEIAQLPEAENFNVWGMDFSPDGKFLAVASPGSYEIHIWDWRRRQIVRKLEKIRQGGSSIMATEPLRYSPDGRLIANCHSRASGGVVVRVWNTETGDVAHDLSLEIGICRALGFTPDGKSLAWISDRPKGDQLMVYSTETWQPVWGLNAAPFYPSTLSISPDGASVALGGSTGGPGIAHRNQILIVDIATRSVARTIEAFPSGGRYSGEHEIQRLAWSPDNVHIAAGARLSAAGTYGTAGSDVIRIFNARSGEKVASETAYHATFWGLRYTPDGRYLIESAIGVPDGTAVSGPKRELLRPDYVERSIQSVVRIWDGQHRRLLQEITGEASSAAVTGDGRRLALGGDGIIFLFELK